MMKPSALATFLGLLWVVALSAGEELFVDEIGENDVNEVISIENELPDVLNRRNKRQVRKDYSYYDGDDEEEEGEEDGSGYDGGVYDIDDTFDEDDDDEDISRDVMPTRVVPSMISPSFEDPGYGNVQTKPSAPSKTAFDVIKTSLYGSAYDEMEGSGNDDYDGPTTILPTKASDMVTTPKTRLPEFSPTFTVGIGSRDREPVITTERHPAMNQPPHIQKKLRRYAVTAGRSLRIQIPEETFFDIEDGNTRHLKLDIFQENGAPLRVSWIKFDQKEQAIYALPFDENGIGRYTFTVTATDTSGESVSDRLEIAVRQYSGARLINHHFSLEFSFTNWDPKTSRGWEWRMLDNIRALYGDNGTDNILVKHIGENPFVFTWTNDSLTQQSCPKSEIRGLFSALVEGEDAAYKSTYGSASSELKNLLGDDFYSKSVSMKYLGACLLDDTIDKVPNVPEGKEDSVPVIRNPIDRINITAGELLRYQVPEDTCYDQEDGKTSQLNLHLLTTNRLQLSPDAWLQFDGRNQEFVGIPLEEEVGREEYQLVCSDENGLSAIDGIEVIVLNRPFNERFGVEFALQFGPNDYGGGGVDGLGFGQPILRRDMKVKIVESLAHYFGDSTTSNVILKTFDAENGRVVWHNKSLAHQPCDSRKMIWVKNQLIENEEDRDGSGGKVVKRLVRHFQPFLRLVDADVVKHGHCLTGSVPTVPSRGGDDGPFGSNRDTIFHGIIPSADYLLTFIIPAVIITCMLILAILLACMLHKKRKAGKLNLFYSEALPPRVPVILQDELYDEHEMGGNKQPVLLREDLMSNSINGRMPENESLLYQQRNIQIDPYGRGSSLGRPTPAYQRRQL